MLSVEGRLFFSITIDSLNPGGRCAVAVMLTLTRHRRRFQGRLRRSLSTTQPPRTLLASTGLREIEPAIVTRSMFMSEADAGDDFNGTTLLEGRTG